MEHTTYLGLGSNLGDRLASIIRAVDALADAAGIRIDRGADLASVYETEPVDAPPGAPSFLNTAVRARTTLPPEELMQCCLDLETRLGRVRSTLNAPRSIDIDLLFYGARVVERPRIIVPHPRLHLRRFVLEPLCELAPDLIHPLLGATIEHLSEEARRQFPDQKSHVLPRAAAPY